MVRTLLFSFLILACGSVKKVRNGTMAYEYKQYAVAIEMLQEELHDRDDPAKRLLLARSYDHLGLTSDAIDQYRVYLSERDDLGVMLEFARVLKKGERYEKAIEIFNILKTEASLDPMIDRGLASCIAARSWKADPDTLVDLTNMPFNTEASEYAMVRIDGQWVFTSDQPESLKSPLYSWTGMGFSDLVTPVGKGLVSFSSSVNTSDNEGTAVLHPNGEEIYFTRCASEGGDDVRCHLYRSRRIRSSEWDKGEKLEGVNGAYNSRHPALSDDGSLLFFSSDRDDAVGGYDIYYSRLNEEDEWGAARPLSQMVNTPEDEVFPFLFGDTLYFASAGHTGMGGLDLFYTYFNSEDQWVRPINMQVPYNSGGDDFAIWFDTINVGTETSRKGSLSSNRTGGKGRDDVYAFEVRRPKPKEKKEDTPWMLTVKVLQPVYEVKGDPNSGMRKMTPVDGAKVTIEDSSYVTDITGIISRRVDSSGILRVRATKEGFLSDARTLNIGTEAKDRMVFVKLIIDPLVYGQEIILKDIYYDFNKWDIRPDARPSLDSLGRLMQNNPELKIKLTSHTDCRGDDDFNMDLSQKRAESALNYLVAFGIPRDRLEAEGFGESRPKVDCICSECTEDQHQQNRRTSFIILR